MPSLPAIYFAHVHGHCQSDALSATGTRLPSDVFARNVCKGSCSSSLESWLQSLLDAAHNPNPELAAHIRLLQACKGALELVKITGFQAALHTVGKSCLGATDKQYTGPSGSDSATPGTSSQADSASGGVVWQTLSASLLTDLADSICHLPLALQALKIGASTAEVNFPKFQKLVQFLEHMKEEKSLWHGIVFVKKRQGVHELTAMLRKMPGLAAHIEFHAYTGHGTGKSVPRVTDGMGNSSTTGGGDGMKIKDQEAALAAFKGGKGCQILIATAAAEEGHDILTCEFVMCYTVVESGREWTQRQGRARMLKSQFVHIIERGSADEVQLVKSKREAENEYAVMLQSGSAV